LKLKLLEPLPWFNRQFLTAINRGYLTMTMTRPALLIGAGCAAACMGVALVPAIVAGTSLTVAVAALRGEAVMTGIAIAAGLAIWGIVRHRSRRSAVAACACGSTDAEGSQCTLPAADAAR
jgi:hypothetical protein